MNKIIRSPIVQTAARVLSAKSKVRYGIATDANPSQAEEEKEAVLQGAEAEADSSVALASEQLQELEATIAQAREAASQEGFQQGYEEGKAKAYQELQSKNQLMQDLIGEIHKQSEKLIAEQEAMLLEVILTSVNKIVGELSQYKEVTRNIIHNVVQEVIDKQSLVIKVSPDDYDWLRHEEFPEYPGIKFIPEDSIRYGGCEVETMGGVIDGRTERQLQAFNSSLLELFRRRQGGRG